jgi:5'(3')-deoxyribonucleotidase
MQPGKKLIALVDVDETVADLHTPWMKRASKVVGRTITTDMVTEWSMKNLFTESEMPLVMNCLTDQTIYDEMEPVPGALMGVRKLRSLGLRVVFVTAALPGETLRRKYQWLKEQGFLDWREHADQPELSDFVQAYDKSLLRGDIMVDDKPENMFDFTGLAILFSQPHNRNHRGLPRADGWASVVTLAETWLRARKADGQKILTDPLDAAIERAQAFEQKVRFKEGTLTMTVGGPNSSTWKGPLPGQDHLASGFKDDSVKLDWSILPWKALAEVVKVYQFGATKYARNNWAKGMLWSRMFSAAMRHMTAFWAGQDIDEETGLNHLTGAIFSLLCLLSYSLEDLKQFDDRDRKSTELPALGTPARYFKEPNVKLGAD